MLNNPSQFLYDEQHHGTFRRMLRRVDGKPGHYDLEIDNSALSTFLTCPRSYEYNVIYGRDTANRDALNYGSAIHHALEMFFRHALDASDTIEHLQSAFHENPTASDSWRTLEHGAEAIRRYIAWHSQMPPWTILHDDAGNPRVENSFRYFLFSWSPPKPLVLDWPIQLVASNVDADTSLVDAVAATTMRTPVSQIDVYYTGKIDMLVELDGAVFVVDHKTTSIEGSTFWSQFNLSPQMRGYCRAASRMLSRPVQSAMIDAIIGRKPTKTGIPHEYSRQRFHYSDEQISAWHRATIAHIHVLLNMFVDGYFPENGNACYGKFPCQFRDVCTLPLNTQPSALRSGAFAPRTWSPLTTNR